MFDMMMMADFFVLTIAAHDLISTIAGHDLISFSQSVSLKQVMPEHCERQDRANRSDSRYDGR